MELPSTMYSVPEMRSVINYLTAQQKSAKEIHVQLCHVYEEQCMSIQKVRKCGKKFEDGWTAVDDMPCSGRPKDSTSYFKNI